MKTIDACEMFESEVKELAEKLNAGQGSFKDYWTVYERYQNRLNLSEIEFDSCLMAYLPEPELEN